MDKRYNENQRLREEFNNLIINNGIMLLWISKTTKIPNSTLSRWRKGGFDFGQEKLDTVKLFLKGYEK